ncbi:MAG TPA: S41 family peptidase [Cyclobacteriaceae bacterium]
MSFRWSFIVLCVLCLSFNVNGQDVCVRAHKILEKMNSLHVQPRAVNDSLSADIFSEFFLTLDPYSQFFIAKDTGSLIRFRNKLDDGNEPVCSFVAESTKLFRKKAEWYRKFTDSVLAKPMDLTKLEFGPSAVGMANDDGVICKTKAELESRILVRLKLGVLMSMYHQASPGDARAKARKNALVKIDALLKDPRALATEVNNSYLKAIPAVFDPHSTYFTKAEMDEFNEGLSPSALSFGIKVGESPMGEVTVSNVVPGSPAWNSNQINKGDVLVGIKWKTSGEYVDLADLDRDVIQDFLDKRNDIAAEITVRKATGEVRNVKLVKEKLENEENIVSGFVLTDKKSKRSVGYISLPGFFTDDNHPELKGCAVAVTRELIKLKGESIQGLILDLRYNGGGSMAEAIDLAGLFIDVGPMSVLEMRGEVPVTMKDANRGLVYDGPLVILVNGASASASELVAGALQDHHRAVIAGSTTYGKANGQDLVAMNESDSTAGFLKVTIMRLFRIDGKSHQLTGVSPDFTLPDLSSVMYHREEQERHAMKGGSTKKKTYYTPLPATWAEALKYTNETDQSPERFAAVNAMQEVLTAKIPLERQAFLAFMKKLEASSAALTKGVSATDETYTVTNSKFDATVLTVDTYHKEINDDILSQVRASVYIHEAYRLLDNIITKKK